MKKLEKKYSYYLWAVLIAVWVGSIIYEHGFLGLAKRVMSISLLFLTILLYSGIFALVLKRAFGIREIRSKVKSVFILPFSFVYHTAIGAYSVLLLIFMSLLLGKETTGYILKFGFMFPLSEHLALLSWYAIIAFTVLIIVAPKLFGTRDKMVIPLLVATVSAWAVVALLLWLFSDQITIVLEALRLKAVG